MVLANNTTWYRTAYLVLIITSVRLMYVEENTAVNNGNKKVHVHCIVAFFKSMITFI